MSSCGVKYLLSMSLVVCRLPPFIQLKSPQAKGSSEAVGFSAGIDGGAAEGGSTCLARSSFTSTSSCLIRSSSDGLAASLALESGGACATASVRRSALNPSVMQRVRVRMGRLQELSQLVAGMRLDLL